MAQKNLPPAAKLDKILEYLKSTMEVYTLKELEKILQSVASVNQLQAKDYLQALQDENLIRVEKIGSGNWYWCFTSDAKRSREKVISNLSTEHARLVELVAITEREIAHELSRREDDDLGTGENVVHNVPLLLETHETLLKESSSLDKEIASFCDVSPTEMNGKLEEVKKLRDSTLLWTENIQALEFFVTPLLSDRVRLAEIMHAVCGDEYVIGEGLREL